MHRNKLKGGIRLMNKIITTLLLLISALSLIACNDQSAEEVNARIAKSDRLTRVDEVCKSLPEASGLLFLDKQVRGNSGIVNVTYYYKFSGKYDQLFALYSEWFEKEGWQRDTTRGLKYSKDKLSVAIERGGSGTADLAISCSQEL